jgi:hypothetical protein
MMKLQHPIIGLCAALYLFSVLEQLSLGLEVNGTRAGRKSDRKVL